MSNFTPIQQHLLSKDSATYIPYYNGKMSYTLHGKDWASYVEGHFDNIQTQTTSENLFKTVIDLYSENLQPSVAELKGFNQMLIPLLCRGEAPVVVDAAGEPHYPERYEMLSDGDYTIAAIFTRSIRAGKDFITFVDTDGEMSLFEKPIPKDYGPMERTGFTQVETQPGTLVRFALPDKGFGPQLAALQDRVNHSIVDLTVVAEMYARPFWYLLNVSLPPVNPYSDTATREAAMQEHKGGGTAGRIFTTSSEGPFGQLQPPTIGDMIAYHDSLMDKVCQTTGIPQHYFKPGQGTPPTGVALKVLNKRFNNKIAAMRESLQKPMEELAELLGVARPEDGEYRFWDTDDDLLQEVSDAHGIRLATMGYPLEYIASVVTPGVDLDEYEEEGGLPSTTVRMPSGLTNNDLT